MNEYMKDEINEVKELEKKIKLLAREIKKDFKKVERDGNVIPDSIKRTVLEGLYYIKDDYTYNMVKNNLFPILYNIPCSTKNKYEINPTIYKKLLEDFYFNMEYKEEYDCNLTILSCINNIRKITVWDERLTSSNSVILFNNIRHTDNLYKKIVCLKLLKNIENLHNEILETKIISILDKTEDEEKLKILDSLIEYIESPNASSLSLYVEKILEYIEKENNAEYFKKLNKITINFYYLIMHSNLVTPKHLEEILSINLENYNNKNIDLLLKLLNINLYKITSFNRILLEIKILDMDYKEKEFEDKFIDLVNNIVLKIEDKELQGKIIDRICSINNIKSLEVFIDLYPILNKYSNEDDLINLLDEIPKNNKDTKVKQLIIPINYSDKED